MNRIRAAQSGFGLLETITGLLVFVLLAIVGTRAYHGVVQNQKEASQVKALTDAVTTTADRLSAMTVKALTEPGSAYLNWSKAAELGNGEYRYRYRTFPNPTISSAPDTAVVGLEVEIAPAGAGAFSALREFATLISPHLNSRDRLGQVSTKAERDGEASFYAGLKYRIHNVAVAAKGENQDRLNSFSCYDKGQCCAFMEKYFLNPHLKTADGLEEKCHYRCAAGGDVSVPEWNAACHTDFCSLAPWKTSADCCAAIAAGECKTGSVCANICIDCVHEDGSGCGKAKCNDGRFNDFFNCAAMTLCDGSPIPATVPGWGDVASLCKLDACKKLANDCAVRDPVCCDDYWGKLALGETPDPQVMICAKISKQSDCCDNNRTNLYWEFACTADGKIKQFRYINKPEWYCGSPNGSWDSWCAQKKGCATIIQPAGGDGSCGAWPGAPIVDAFNDPFPGSPGTHFTMVEGGAAVPAPDAGPGVPIIGKGKDTPRVPSDRDGTVKGSEGGHE